MTLLEDLWYSNVDPHETFLDGNRQFKSLLALLGKNQNALEETRTNLQKETLEKYDDVNNEMHSLAEVEAFAYGVRLGVRLMIELSSPENTL